MNATYPAGFTNSLPVTEGAASVGPHRFSIRVGATSCEIRVRSIEPIAAVLGFEEEMDMAAGLMAAGAIDADGAGQGVSGLGDGTGGTVADLLESRMIAPPRPRHRRQRAVSSRALFFGRGR